MTGKTSLKISLISALDSYTQTIGRKGGGLPWHIPEDFKYFKEKTTGHPIIMGRKTWEEFNGKPLPGRHHIVITNQENYEISPEIENQISVVKSLEEALALAKSLEEKSANDNKEIFVIGGAQIYKLALPHADRLYLTLVKAGVDGPAKFPDYQSAGFNKIISSRKSSDRNFEYEFAVLEK